MKIAWFMSLRAAGEAVSSLGVGRYAALALRPRNDIFIVGGVFKLVNTPVYKIIFGEIYDD